MMAEFSALVAHRSFLFYYIFPVTNEELCSNVKKF